MGMEKILAHVSGRPKFSPMDLATLNRTVLSLDEALAIAQQAKSPTCYLQSNQTVINHDGSVALCCTVYDPVNFISSDFLSVDREDLQNRKKGSSLCPQCMSHGLHDYAMYKPNDQWEEASTRKQVESGQQYVTTMFAKPHIHQKRESKIKMLRNNIAKIINTKPL